MPRITQYVFALEWGGGVWVCRRAATSWRRGRVWVIHVTAEPTLPYHPSRICPKSSDERCKLCLDSTVWVGTCQVFATSARRDFGGVDHLENDHLTPAVLFTVAIFFSLIHCWGADMKILITPLCAWETLLCITRETRFFIAKAREQQTGRARADPASLRPSTPSARKGGQGARRNPSPARAGHASNRAAACGYLCR